MILNGLMKIIKGLWMAFSLLMLWSVLTLLIGFPLKGIAGSAGIMPAMLLALVLTVWIYVRSRNKQSTAEIAKSADKYALPASEIQTEQPWQIVERVKRETQALQQITKGESEPYRRVVLQVSLPSNSKWEPERAQRLMRNLFAANYPFNLVLRAKQHEFMWCIEVGANGENALKQMVYALYPHAAIKSSLKLAFDQGYELNQIELFAPYVFPLKVADDFGHKISPMASIVGSMSGLQEHEEIVYELALRPITRDYIKIGNDLIYTRSEERFAPEVQNQAKEKLNILQFMEAKILFKVKAPAQARTAEIIGTTVSFYEQFSRENANAFTIAAEDSYPVVLTPNECAALWHLPTDDCQVAGIAWAKSAAAPLPAALVAAQKQHQEGIVLGENTYQGVSNPVRLDYPDRVTHVNIIGRTRVGKTTLMHNMIHQDIQNGKGVGVIDPHGDLVNAILACSIPPEREHDVVLFDVTDVDYPIGLNLLSVPAGVTLETGASQALDVIRKMFADDWSASRMENVLYACLIALVNYEGATLQDVTRLPINADFRNEVLKGVTDVTALEYWYEVHDSLSARAQLEIAQPIMNRIQRFYREPKMRRIICQKNSLDFSHLLNRKKIFLANLGGLSGIESETLGALMISKIQMAAMSRAHLAAEQRAPFYCYIDEVQNFVTTSLGKMFSEAAKYGLSLVVANQFLSQLSGDTLDAIIGNVGTTLMFRCGPDDARLLGRFIRPQFDADTLLNLDRFATVVKMQQAGETMPAFSIATPEPLKPGNDDELIDSMRKASREAYGRPAEEIDAELAQRYQRHALGEEPVQAGSSDKEPAFFG